MPEYTVTQGDSIASIAHAHGFYWETIWDHSNNAELRELRENPNILYPGDVVFIPDREERQESGETNQRHRFRVQGLSQMLRIRLLDRNDEPRSDVPYTLEIGGNSFTGTTDPDGILEHSVPPDVSNGTLRIGESDEEGTYQITVGTMDPIDENSGVQARLNNLGFYGPQCEINGEMDQETIGALRRFQRKHNLDEIDEISESARNRLSEIHGS